MEIIQICPICGQPALPVNSKAVEFNLIDSTKLKNPNNFKWCICINPGCAWWILLANK